MRSRFDHQQVQVAVGMCLSSGRRAKEDNLLGLRDGDDTTNHFGEYICQFTRLGQMSVGQFY